MICSSIIRVVVGVALFCGLASCVASTSDEGQSGTGADQDQSVSISVSPALHHNPTTREVDATFQVTIRNTGSESLFFNECGTTLQRATGTEWRQVWAEVCTTGEQPRIELPAGNKFEFEVRIRGVLGRDNTRDWTEPLNGEYRLIVGTIAKRRENLSIADKTSPPFTIQAN